MRCWLAIWFFLGCVSVSYAQPLRLLITACDSKDTLENRIFADSLAAGRWLSDRQLAAWSKGQLSYALVELASDSTGRTFCEDAGVTYQWGNISMEIPERWRLPGSKSLKRLSGKTINAPALESDLRQWLVLAENSGHPFARWQLEEVQLAAERVDAKIVFYPGRAVLLDSLRLGGDLPLKPWVLARYLQWQEGAPYDQRTVAQINRRLAALNYAGRIETSQLFFYNNKAALNLLVGKRPVSSFDGMLGVFPGTGTNGRLLVTGDLNLLLWSALKRGERLSFNWRSLQAGTQDLRAGVRWPFLFRSPVGIDSDFRLFRRDSSFLEVQALAGLEYTFGPGHYLKGFWQQRNYRQLAPNPGGLVGNGSTNGQVYGLEYGIQQLDKAYNPYRGWSLVAGAGAGQRSVQQQGADASTQNFPLYQFQLDAQAFVPWRKRWQSHVAVYGKGMFSQSFLPNESFRLGGFRTLKGFDEESLNATAYLLWNAEQRFLLDADSWLYVFANGGWLQQQWVTGNFSDRPIGFGAGLTFQNRSGIFSVAYALGTNSTQALQFRNTKVHLGYRYLL